MATASVLQRLTQRAKQADELIVQLRAQIELVQKSAAISVSKPEEERLRLENAALKEKISKLKMTLAIAEIKNGVKQIPLPIRKAKVESEATNNAPVPQKPVTMATNKAAGDGATKGPEEKKGKGAKNNQKEKKDTQNQGGGDAAPKKGKVEKKSPPAPDADRAVDISRLDLRVGKIVGVSKHPDADSLYVEDVDLGEGQTRTIVSGLVKHVPIEEMQDRLAVFMCNLKPAKMRGIMSQGMIMCASGPDKVEILLPPTGAQIGDRVATKEYPGAPDALLNPKKKIWEGIKPDLKTDGSKVAAYKGAALFIEGKGQVIAPTMANTQIS